MSVSRSFQRDGGRGKRIRAGFIAPFILALLAIFLPPAPLVAREIRQEAAATIPLAAPASGAADRAPAIIASPDPGLIVAKVPLNSLQAEQRPQVLHFDRDSFELSFALGARFEPAKAALHLEFTNSIALVDTRSQLRAYVGDVLIAQLPLHGSQPRVSADIDIPVDLLEAGYNKLIIAVVQHYGGDCEDPAAPELWTEIDTTRSNLTFAGHLAALKPTLAQLDQLLGPGVGGIKDFLVISPKAEVDDSLLRAGSMITQALAFRLRYRPASMSYAGARLRKTVPTRPGRFPNLDDSVLVGHDVVMVGTRDELAPYLPEDIIDQITDGFLGTYALDDDPSRLLLLVSGRTQEEIEKAARALGVLNYPFDNVDESVVHAVDVPDDATFLEKNLVEPDRVYHFSDFGYRTSSVRSSSAFDYPIRFDVPADLYASEDAKVEMKLDFSYGAGLDPRSVINVFINNTFERAISLDQRTGAILRGYLVNAPLRSFQPGRNTIRFEIALMSVNAGKCQDVSHHENMIFTLFDGSTVAFPSAFRVASQPDLQLLGRSGFPFTVMPHGHGLDVAVTDRSPSTVVAAWELMGKLAQTTGEFLDQTALHFTWAPTGNHLLVVGPVNTLDPLLLRSSQANLSEGLAGVTDLPYQSSSLVPSVEEASGFLKSLLQFVSAAPPASPRLPPSVRSTGALNDFGAIFSFESPDAPRHTVVVVTAQSAARLLDRVDDLVNPAIWSQLRGDITVWRGPKDPVQVVTAARPFTIGDRTSVDFFSFYVSAHPLPWMIAVVTAVLGFAALTMCLLRRRRRRLHPDASESE